MEREFNISKMYEPQQPQRKFHESPAKFRLLGGSAGGGKTYAIIWEAVMRAISYDFPVTIAIFRKSYPELDSTIIRTMLEILPRWVYKYNQSQHVLTLFNGSRIEFCYAESDKDVIRYQSREWDALGIDELTHFSKYQFTYLMTRLRTTKPLKTKFFAATNPGNIGHCVPYGEVLTPNGWVDIKDISIGNKVMTLLDDGSIKYINVDQVIEEDYKGKLYKSDSHNAQFECTPNHKIVRITETKNKDGRMFHEPSLIEVKNISGVTRLPKIGKWKSKSPKFFKLEKIKHRKLKLKQPLKIKFNDYCELMGWFLSEGSTIENECRVIISQKKIVERELIRILLSRCGFKYREYKSDFVFYSPEWWEYLRKFGNSREKYVPREILNSNITDLRTFFLAIMLGDGDKNNIYYTLSNKLADGMEEVGLKLGYRTRRTKRLRKGRKYESYEIKLKQNRIGWLEKDNIKTVDYEGKVYCLGIENLHRFYLKQNGTVYLSGNSWVKERWITKDCKDEGYKPEEYEFVPARVQENKYIMDANPDYIANLEALPEKEKRALLFGDWDVYEGQFFTEFDQHVHVKKPFEIPDTWRIVMGWDEGTKAPRSVHLYAIDNDQRVWCFWEYYKAGENLVQAAENIRTELKRDGLWNRVFKCVVDSAMNTPGQEGITDVKILEDMGFGFKVGDIELANKDREMGWRIVKSYLSHKPYEEPLLKFFSTCDNMIRTIPELIYYSPRSGAESKKEDIDTTQEDHAADDLRYVLMSLERVPDRFREGSSITIEKRVYNPIHQ